MFAFNVIVGCCSIFSLFLAIYALFKVNQVVLSEKNNKQTAKGTKGNVTQKIDMR